MHVFETGEVHTVFWWGNLRERGHLKNVGIDVKKGKSVSLQALGAQRVPGT